MDLYLKPDWPETQARLLRWWQHQGLAVCLLNRRARTQPPLLPPAAPADEYTHWIDPTYRLALAEYEQAAYEYLAEAFPYFETQIGPGSLGAMLGAGVILDPATVWYRPCILDPEAYGVIKFQSKNNPWWETHRAMLAAGRQYFGSRIPVGIPDLIEGLDTLSAMRGEMNLLFDLKERPAWVHARLAEINQAYFEVYELIYAMIKGPDDSSVYGPFRLWAPGRTAKLQCDFSAMISPAMFRAFVTPYLTEQCRRLDYTLYHLDGTTALQQLEPLLEITELDAIEWTPQGQFPGGGSPVWFDLYRRIKGAGKSVQAVDVALEDVLPLLDAVGPAGMYLQLKTPPGQAEAEKLMRALEPYYC